MVAGRDYLNPNGEVSRSYGEGQLQARRKVAKMLIAVVVMFGICYLPVHLLNILRYCATTIIFCDPVVRPLCNNFASLGSARQKFLYISYRVLRTNFISCTEGEKNGLYNCSNCL